MKETYDPEGLVASLADAWIETRKPHHVDCGDGSRPSRTPGLKLIQQVNVGFWVGRVPRGRVD